MIIALFEDEKYTNLLPMTYTRPVFELRCGVFSFMERVGKTYPESRIFFFTRDYLVPTLRERVSSHINEPNAIDEDVLLLNGSLLLDNETKELTEKKSSSNTVVTHQNRVAFAHLNERTAKKHGEFLCEPLVPLSKKGIMKECKTLEGSEIPLLTYPWDLICNNSDQLRKDIVEMNKKEIEGTIDERAVVYGDEASIYVGKDSLIEALVTLDAREGPIYIGNGVQVHGGSRITGPAYIGDDTRIVTGLIREGCSIGPVCRVGGEVEETIIQGYTNKYHTGFLGHAYVGEWVNIAADTTASDIKNTYGTVRMHMNGEKVDSEQFKLGCFLGDYSKTSIGTCIYAGKKIGVASQMHGFVSEDVPSFTIWAKSLGKDPTELYLESAVKTQRRMMARRKLEQTGEDIRLLIRIFEMTAEEREKAGVVNQKFEANFE